MVIDDVIGRFRDQVNSNSMYTLHNYKDRDEKNAWNIICACMDWIDVGVEHLSKFNFSKQSMYGLEIYAYISAIDIIFQAVQQLHRVITGDNKIIFKDDKDTFSDNRTLKSDNEYFKHIRAIFGAHPVNLDKDHNQEKWFASWPNTRVYEEYDVTVMLYNVDPNKDDKIFGIKISELNSFFEKRYNHLIYLGNELEKQYNEYKREVTKRSVEQSDDILEQINILKRELTVRLSNEYFEYTVNNLELIFSAPITNNENIQAINAYRSVAKNVVDELIQKINQMDYTDLETDFIISPRFPNGLHYNLSKLFECLHGERQDFLYNFYIEELSEFFKEIVAINDGMPREEIFLLLHVALYDYSQNEDE